MKPRLRSPLTSSFKEGDRLFAHQAIFDFREITDKNKRLHRSDVDKNGGRAGRKGEEVVVSGQVGTSDLHLPVTARALRVAVGVVLVRVAYSAFSRPACILHSQVYFHHFWDYFTHISHPLNAHTIHTFAVALIVKRGR